MSSFFSTEPIEGAAEEEVRPPFRPDPWMAAIALLAGVLLVGGGITVAIGLDVVHGFTNTVLGQDQRFDGGVATAITGGAAIVLGILVGTAWLVVGAVRSVHR